MKVTLIRHGQTEENYLKKLQGRSNCLLNDTGRRQVLKLKNKLSTLNYDLCFTSPLIRCFETAIVVVGDRTEIIRDDRLIERDLGEMEGRPVEEYNAFTFWDYKRNRSDYGVEPVRDMIGRCSEFLEEIKEKYPDKSIMVVTHGGPYRALRHLLKGDKLEGNLLDGKIENCSCEEFEI